VRILSDDLVVLQRVALRRATRLRLVAAHCVSPGLAGPDREAGLTYCIIELQTLWEGFSRALFLSSALSARDSTGRRVSVGASPRPRTIDEALTHAIRRVKPGLYKRKQNPPWSWSDEPKWSGIRALLDSMDEVGCSNRSRVAAALSTQTAVFDHLRLMRNFYAHRGRDTRQKLHSLVVTYSLPPTLHPSGVLLLRARVSGVLRPQPLLLDWIDDVINTVSLVV